MQPRRLVAFEIHFGGEGGHRDGTLAQDVSNIVDVVGAFLQKQPAGEGGVPVPAVIVNAAVKSLQQPCPPFHTKPPWRQYSVGNVPQK